MNGLSTTVRAGLLALSVTGAASALAQDARTFRATDGSYAFQYPLSFWFDTEFADGSGERTGVKASTPQNGDVVIRFHSRPANTVRYVSAQTRQAIVDDYIKTVAIVPSIGFKSATMTTMLGKPAVDMVFENRRFGRPSVNRYVVTVVDGREYSFICLYRVDKAAEFAPACDLAVSTVRLRLR
ncbi:hypothetical protein ACQKLX_12115 [Bosea sp. NPDC003192]|uniref:hypothetical protein n=1 Tax=Bosea sp. NPDC003192 TaxID=3390551 RepID=UPI003CFE41C0